jgi:hypothetical protein
MGIRDLHNMFSDSQAVSASAVGTNKIDLGVAMAVSVGEPMCVVFNVEVAADQTSGDEDYTFDVETFTDEAQTAGRELMGRRVFQSGTPTAPAQDADLLVAGFQVVIPIPPTTIGEGARYIGVRYTTAGNTPTITVSAFMIPLSFVEQRNLIASAVVIG